MQNGVSICTPDYKLEPVYGSLKLRSERELARSSLRYLLTDVNDIRCSYIRLGFHLNEFNRMKYYEDFGFDSFMDFVSANLGLDKSAVSRCISVFMEFSARNNSSCHQRTMYLDEKYSSFSYSQLCEMVSMSSKQRQLVKPEMTIKQIRELKKQNNVSREKEDVSQVATSQRQDSCPFDYKHYLTLHGAAKYNYVKKIVSECSFTLDVYDSDGHPVESLDAVSADLIGSKGNHWIFRLRK